MGRRGSGAHVLLCTAYCSASATACYTFSASCRSFVASSRITLRAYFLQKVWKQLFGPRHHVRETVRPAGFAVRLAPAKRLQRLLIERTLAGFPSGHRGHQESKEGKASCPTMNPVESHNEECPAWTAKTSFTFRKTIHVGNSLDMDSHPQNPNHAHLALCSTALTAKPPPDPLLVRRSGSFSWTWTASCIRPLAASSFKWPLAQRRSAPEPVQRFLGPNCWS